MGGTLIAMCSLSIRKFVIGISKISKSPCPNKYIKGVKDRVGDGFFAPIIQSILIDVKYVR